MTPSHPGILSALLDGLDTADLRITTLVDQVAEIRGRPIRLAPWRLPDEQYGAWIATTTNRDYIFFEARTAKFHQAHIILHELSHMLLGHPTIVIAEEDLASIGDLLMRAVDQLRHVERERDAESLATAIQREVIRRSGLQALTRRIATAPRWTDIALGLGLDR